jgi:hypothetical protein
MTTEQRSIREACAGEEGHLSGRLFGPGVKGALLRLVTVTKTCFGVGFTPRANP